MKEIHYSKLLDSYRALWNNRSLQLMDEHEPKTILNQAIHRELLDEYSHPRVRKSKEEKFYLAIKRITDSSLDIEDKMDLIQLHVQVMTDFRTN